MSALRIVRLKPNPTGKDRTHSGTPARQLTAEWVDFQNVSSTPCPLEGVSLYHVAFRPGTCSNGQSDRIDSYQGSLQPGQIVRVHSGQPISLASMNTEDVTGADFHFFTKRDYVWNNDCGDVAGLGRGSEWIDRAAYDPCPPEGKILVRQGNKLL
jgi:hypothetical protein